MAAILKICRNQNDTNHWKCISICNVTSFSGISYCRNSEIVHDVSCWLELGEHMSSIHVFFCGIDSTWEAPMWRHFACIFESGDMGYCGRMYTTTCEMCLVWNKQTKRPIIYFTSKILALSRRDRNFMRLDFTIQEGIFFWKNGEFPDLGA